jgi:NAD(P)-dependent dehydrogenase (short-subunit alcohol dehydrogenase family)
MLQKLEGKTAVITGGKEGVGLATAELFVKEGAYVFNMGRRQKELDEAVVVAKQQQRKMPARMPPLQRYSKRSARAGSIEEARRAGIMPASEAAMVRMRMEPTSTTVSTPLTS